MKIPYYKRNKVRNSELFIETMVSAQRSLTLRHQLKYLSMTEAKLQPGGHHPTLFLNDIYYISFSKNRCLQPYVLPNNYIIIFILFNRLLNFPLRKTYFLQKSSVDSELNSDLKKLIAL